MEMSLYSRSTTYLLVSEPAPSANFEKIVYSDAIWNDILELQRQFWKQGRACNLTLFETRITSETIFENNVSKTCILTVFKTILELQGTFYKHFL